MIQPRYQTPIHRLYLPTRIERYLLRAGIKYVEELLGSDPFESVQAIGPDDHWIGPHTLDSGTRLQFYKHTVDPAGSWSLRRTWQPWRDIYGIGLWSTLVIMETVEIWREENRAFERGGR